jgi:hypothetical protein
MTDLQACFRLAVLAGSYSAEGVGGNVALLRLHDVDCYVILSKSPDFALTYFRYSYVSGNFRHTLTGDFVHKVAYARYEVL